MTKPTTHLHPNPRMQRLTHYAAFALLIILLMTIPLQIVLAFALSGGLLLFGALCMLLLAAPLVMFLSATPAVTLEEEGILIQPILWKEQFVGWEQIEVMKRYPLLPQPDQEVERRMIVGRKKYRAAEGKMLLVQGLPWQYRVAGYFVGERGRAIIALTNRSHSDYDRLIQRLGQHVLTEQNEEEL